MLIIIIQGRFHKILERFLYDANNNCSSCCDKYSNMLYNYSAMLNNYSKILSQLSKNANNNSSSFLFTKRKATTTCSK